MADYTDARLRELEAFLQNLYKDAEADLWRKWDDFMYSREKKAEKYREAIAKATTPEAKTAAEKKYKQYLTSTTAGDARYRAMVEETARQYAAVTERAQEIINGERSAFFADGYNFVVGEVNDVAIRENIGVRFDITSKEAVDRLARETLRDRMMMPEPQELDIPADERWNAKLINSQVAQGIVQGESIPKIANRLTAVTDGVVSACVRRARTMATSCQNAGRVDAMKNAENLGVKTRKKWLCTHDGRTRDSHLLLDGETEAPDGVFWNGCRFPGDPIGPPKEVWGCRCTLITVVDGFSSNLPKGKEGAIHVFINDEEITASPKPEIPAVGFNLARKLRSAKAAQDMTTDELREIGKAFYNSPEYKAAMQEYSPEEIQKKIAALDEERDEARRIWRDSNSSVESKKALERIHEINEEKLRLQSAGKDIVSRLIAEVRGETRGFSSEQQRKDHLGRMTETKEYIVDAYARYPASWVQLAANTGSLTVKKVSRGYCLAKYREIALSSSGNDAKNTAVHELGHYFEEYIQGLRNAANQFYQERTAGEKLEKLRDLTGNKAYKTDEVTRKDKFTSFYMGKDYGTGHTELISMGMEGIIGFTNHTDLSQDEDMRNWITGILLAF